MVQSSCLCGKNRIQIDAEPSLQFICHCADERKLTGAAFALNMMYPAATLKVISGKLATYTKTADSGNKMTNHSCDECGGLLYRSSSGFPDDVILKAGLIDGFDAAKEFKPVAEVFTRSRLPWLRPLEGVPQEPGDFGSAAAGEAEAMN
jgi:hypothetical protein